MNTVANIEQSTCKQMQLIQKKIQCNFFFFIWLSKTNVIFRFSILKFKYKNILRIILDFDQLFMGIGYFLFFFFTCVCNLASRWQYNTMIARQQLMMHTEDCLSVEVVFPQRMKNTKPVSIAIGAVSIFCDCLCANVRCSILTAKIASFFLACLQHFTVWTLRKWTLRCLVWQ